MNHLLTITDRDFVPDTPDIDRSDYVYQESSRAIVLNDRNEIALMHTGVYEIHKLPGGTIEADETPEETCRRECAEEVGYDVEIVQELGYIDEYKDKRREHRRSYCYVVRTTSHVGQQLSHFEEEGKFELIWAPLSQAIKRMQDDQPVDYDGRFIHKRDLEFLLTYQRL